MSKVHKHGLPSDGELADDELEISGGAGDEPAQNAAGRGVGPSPGDSSTDIKGGIDQKTGAGSAGWG
ncbi:MAG: hypothetical protein QOG73_3194 [Acetobacteraceae bacterium]|jgi:hypothetical protein|nr:hypothetical protein [Acetobacteraceae bacterium]